MNQDTKLKEMGPTDADPGKEEEEEDSHGPLQQPCTSRRLIDDARHPLPTVSGDHPALHGLENTTCWCFHDSFADPDEDDVEANHSIRHSPRMHGLFQQRHWDSSNLRHSMSSNNNKASWANFRNNMTATCRAFVGRQHGMFKAKAGAAAARQPAQEVDPTIWQYCPCG